MPPVLFALRNPLTKGMDIYSSPGAALISGARFDSTVYMCIPVGSTRDRCVRLDTAREILGRAEAAVAQWEGQYETGGHTIGR